MMHPVTPKFKRRLIELLFACTFCVVGFCVLVIAAGLALSAPSRAVIGNPPPDLLEAETIKISSASGALLRGWWLSGKPGGGAVILMHGVRANRLSLVRRAKMLHAHGFSVLLFDFQAHGESTGKRITFGHLEALDAEAAVTDVRKRLPGERVGAIGISLGGAASLLGSKPLDVDALVIESVYPDIEHALTDRFQARLGPAAGSILAPVLTPAFMLVLPSIVGVNPDDLRPIDHIKDVRSPILIAAGTADDHTTLAEAQTLYDKAPDPKTFWAVSGAGHVDLEHFDSNGYWTIVLPFLTENLQAAWFSLR